MDAVKFLKTATRQSNLPEDWYVNEIAEIMEDYAFAKVNRDFYGIPENNYLYKDSGLWQLRDDQDDILHQQSAKETFYDFVLRTSKVMGWEQKP